MPRIQPVNPQQAEGKTRELLDAIKSRLGMTPNLTRTMAHSPATLGGYVGLSRALTGGALSAREREQIALVIAEANGCDYCLAAHSAAGRLVGLSELELRDARRGHATATREDAIVSFAREVLEKHGRVTDETLRRVRQAGLTEGEITEIVANVALHFFTNSLNLVARTDVDFPTAPALETANIQ